MQVDTHDSIAIVHPYVHTSLCSDKCSKQEVCVRMDNGVYCPLKAFSFSATSVGERRSNEEGSHSLEPQHLDRDYPHVHGRAGEPASSPSSSRPGGGAKSTRSETTDATHRTLRDDTVPFSSDSRDTFFLHAF